MGFLKKEQARTLSAFSYLVNLYLTWQLNKILLIVELKIQEQTIY